MGLLRSVVASVEVQLAGLGYRRAAENFTLETVPGSVAHRSYTFAATAIQPLYHAADISDYAGSTLGILILWKARGAHNASGSFQEAYLDLLDAYEEIEDALVKNQTHAADANNLIAGATIEPLFDPNGQEWLSLRLDLNLDALRAM